MPQLDLEYTVCILQRDVFSFAAKSHRQENGDPKLIVDVTETNVMWTLANLDQGVPEIVSGEPQADRIDFYFRREILQTSFSQFPNPRSDINSGMKLQSTSSAGTERREGKRVRIVQPICRFFPVESVKLMVNKTPPFEAVARDAYLHLDIETGPAKYYGKEIFEFHFGIQADYQVNSLQGVGRSQARLTLSHELYSTILNELYWALR